MSKVWQDGPTLDAGTLAVRRQAAVADPPLTAADVMALCDAAAAAWDRLPRHGRRATFTWYGRRYVVHRTDFRLVVDTPDGQPVACRWL
jgi:hypothetical protein